ncbi:MAG: hypothetical protein WBG71_08955 [Leeuwenhoekiella sp.]
MKSSLCLILAILIFLNSCKEKPENETTHTAPEPIPVEADGGIGDGALALDQAIISRIERAHGKSNFKSGDAIQFKIDLDFGGKNRLSGLMTTTPSNDRIRIDYKDGNRLLFDGKKVTMTPKDATASSARFDIFTWAYFFAFPYKLNDGGTNFEIAGEGTLKDDRKFEIFKLSFDPGTGDAPDDWYVGYLNPDGSIRAAGYIVTFNKEQEKAEKSPHAILYDNYENIDGIPFATQWSFYNWNADTGISGEPLGNATLSEFRVFQPEEGFFEAPKDAQIIAPPSKS